MIATLDRIIQDTRNGVGDSGRHLVTLFGIALSLQAKRILELGVRGGDTTRPLLLAATLNGGKLTSVDLQPTSYVPEDPMRWEFAQGDAIWFLELCIQKGLVFDLIYVDDDHTYQHVSDELALISTLITPSSVVLLHDLMGTNLQPNYLPREGSGEWAGGGPARAVHELDPKIWEWATIPASNGLTLLRKKT